MNQPAKQVATVEPGQSVPNNAPAVAGNENQAMLDMIQQVALNPNIDVEKLRAVMDMKLEMFNRGAEIEFNAAMARAQNEMEPVVRTAHNKQTNSKYAVLENIIEQLSPIWTRHGFALSFGTADCPTENYYRVECELTHSAGHSKRYHADLPSDITGIQGSVNKTGIHGFGSTMSYGRRYLVCMVFNVAVKTEDDDGNAADPENAPIKMLERLLKHNDMVRAHLPTILAIKEGIALNELSGACEAWSELEESEQRALWVATTKGGIFSTEERKIMKTNAFYEAYHGPREPV